MNPILSCLATLARSDGPTPMIVRAWSERLLESDAAYLLLEGGPVPDAFERSLQADLTHMLRRGVRRSAFRTADEGGATRFALDVLSVCPATY